MENKENKEIEESESEVFGQQIIGETTNRLRMEEMDREDENENDNDNGEIEEIEEGDSDEVFEEQSKNKNNIEKNEKDKEVEEDEGEKTCGKNNEQKKGNVDPCGECSKPVKEKPWGGSSMQNM